jgi:cytochrome c2
MQIDRAKNEPDLTNRSYSKAPSLNIHVGRMRMGDAEMHEERMRVIVTECRGCHQGGVFGRLLCGPSIDGIGFRRAFAIGIRGTP